MKLGRMYQQGTVYRGTAELFVSGKDDPFKGPYPLVTVSVTRPYFESILAAQEMTQRDYPGIWVKAHMEYGLHPACWAPRWWYEAYLVLVDGVGLQPHEWRHTPTFDKLTLHPYPANAPQSIRGPMPGDMEGTIIFRRLKP